MGVDRDREQSSLREGPFDTFETYQCTDACWFAVLPKEWIFDTLDEIREEAAEALTEE